MNKKEIIINGVNVSRCKHYDIDNNYCDQSYLGEGGLLKNTKNPKKCEQSPNCYYKQLKRLEQENEELKEEYQQAHDDFITSDACLRIANTEKDKLKHALEEIKAELEDDLTCESRECGCDDYGECLECLKETILNIITEAIGE